MNTKETFYQKEDRLFINNLRVPTST